MAWLEPLRLIVRLDSARSKAPLASILERRIEKLSQKSQCLVRAGVLCMSSVGDSRDRQRWYGLAAHGEDCYGSQRRIQEIHQEYLMLYRMRFRPFSAVAAQRHIDIWTCKQIGHLELQTVNSSLEQ